LEGGDAHLGHRAVLADADRALGLDPQRRLSRWARSGLLGGFALFGWAYALWSFGPWSGAPAKPAPLATTVLLDELHKRAHPEPQYEPDPNYPNPQGVTFTTVFVGGEFMGPRMRLKPGSVVWLGKVEHYQQVGHALGALLFALIGGFWGRYTFDRHEPS
ncbi:MAG: hypothetical protein IRY99_01475, partial [Isosphaeraceae bacterium]|nr:hypothetical protein [Isosphaeraceae bacterium]